VAVAWSLLEAVTLLLDDTVGVGELDAVEDEVAVSSSRGQEREGCSGNRATSAAELKSFGRVSKPAQTRTTLLVPVTDEEGLPELEVLGLSVSKTLTLLVAVGKSDGDGAGKQAATRRMRALRVSAMRSEPSAGWTAMPDGVLRYARVAGPPSPPRFPTPKQSDPATVVIVPFGDTRRTKCAPLSAISSEPSAGCTATSVGPISAAATAGLPSAERPALRPEPATVVMVPVAHTRRMRLLQLSLMYSEKSAGCTATPARQFTVAYNSGDGTVRPHAANAVACTVSNDPAAVPGVHCSAVR
jgi:hypothetical protein